MNENTISQISQLISNDIDLSIYRKDALNELEFSIDKINNLLETEKIRQTVVENELKINNNLDKKNLLEYLISIEKNIKKLTLFLEILDNKKKVLFFDTKNYFKSIEEFNLNQTVSIL